MNFCQLHEYLHVNVPVWFQVGVTLRANTTAGLGSTSAGGFSVDAAGSVDIRKAARRVQAQQRYQQLTAENQGGGSSPGKGEKDKMQWTQGQTQFTND